MSVVYSGDKITFADSTVQSSAPIGFKNRIINGAMMIDQRNAGSSVTIGSGNTYTLDIHLLTQLTQQILGSKKA